MSARREPRRMASLKPRSKALDTSVAGRPSARSAPPLPQFVPPQLATLASAPPEGDGWLHEIKYDGYRMHARIDGRDIKLLTRTGLDWSHR
jgi:bifunctional non-homologous end joining protein LigD